MLRLLMSKNDYLKCRGGVTVLNDDIAIDWWQVRLRVTMNDDSSVSSGFDH